MRKYQLVALLALTVLIAYGLYALGYVRCWYASILSFPLGFLFYENYSSIVQFCKSKKGLLVISCLGITGMSSVLLNNDIFVAAFITNNALCIVALIVLVMFSNVFYVENPIKKFLNKYATEIFLFQFIFLTIAETAGWNYWFRMIFVLGMDILVAILVHPLMKALKYTVSCK